MIRILLRIFLSLILFFSCISIFSADSIPNSNAIIVNYVKTVIGKKIDRGECWDLAYEALTLIHAKWDGKFKYGRLLNPDKDTIYPGDIIQFKKVVVEYKSSNGLETTRQTMNQHTAIVFKVNGIGDYDIAHQNTNFSGRKVGISKLVLKNIKKGKIYIYRPIN